MRLHRLVVRALVIGLALNVLVAWACALWSPAHWTHESYSDNPPPDDVISNVPTSWQWLRIRRPDPSSLQGLDYTLNHGRGIGISVTEWGSSSRSDDFYGYPTGPTRIYCLLETGWPFQAMTADALIDRGCIENWSIEPPSWLRPLPSISFVGKRRVPLRPAPLAFAANTVLYSIVVLGMLVTPPFVRSRWRHHCGRCPTCAYDCRGLPPASPCPECGSSNLN